MNHVDTPINIVEMCAGYGGIGLGIRKVLGDRLRCIAYAEIETFAIELLLARMEGGQLDEAPIWPDLKSFPYREFHGLVDILVAGYPCQPFSAAGKRAGKDDPRHLWPWIADGIAAMRPSLCFFENVEGHISLGLSDVIEDLAGMGYRTTWGIFSASEVGGPHQRKRVFIMAYDLGQRIEKLGRQVADVSEQHSAWHPRGDVWPSRPGEPQHGWEPPRVVGNPERLQLEPTRDTGAMGEEGRCAGAEGSQSPSAAEESGYTGGQMGNSSKHDRGNLPERSATLRSEQPSRGQTKPSLGGDLDGSSRGMGYAELQESDQAGSGTCDESRQRELDDSRSDEPNRIPDQQWQENPTTWESGYAELCISCDNRTDELRMLGNGVVPATAERAFRTLLNELLA